MGNSGYNVGEGWGKFDRTQRVKSSSGCKCGVIESIKTECKENQGYKE